MADIPTVNSLFLKKIQSAVGILLLIEDVFPSRIGVIFNAKDEVDKIFSDNSDRGFTFGTIRTFFLNQAKGKENAIWINILTIVDSVFNGQPLDWNSLVKFFMATIHRKFINENFGD